MDKTRSQLALIAQIDHMIRQKGHVSAKDLAENLEVSVRTIYRFIEWMRDRQGAPIEYDKNQKGYYYTEPTYAIPVFKLTQGELISIFLAQKTLAMYQGTPYYDQLKAAFDKMSAILPDQVSINLAGFDQSFSFRIPATSLQDIDIFNTLSQALLTREQVLMSYHSQYSNEDSQRRVEPYHIVNVGGEWYMIGFCHERDDMRIFAISRISKIQLTGDRFHVPDDFNIMNFLAGAFSIFTGNPQDSGSYSIRIHFDAMAARYIREKIWHKSQTIEERPDGSLILSLNLSSLVEVKSWVLSWGEHVEVLAPPELVDEMKQTADSLYQRYHQRT